MRDKQIAHARPYQRPCAFKRDAAPRPLSGRPLRSGPLCTPIRSSWTTPSASACCFCAHNSSRSSWRGRGHDCLRRLLRHPPRQISHALRPCSGRMARRGCEPRVRRRIERRSTRSRAVPDGSAIMPAHLAALLDFGPPLGIARVSPLPRRGVSHPPWHPRRPVTVHACTFRATTLHRRLLHGLLRGSPSTAAYRRIPMFWRRGCRPRRATNFSARA